MDSSSLFRVDGLVAVITGGGDGLGLMMARAFAGAGAKRVYILGRREATLETAASEHSSIVPLVCDVTSKPSLQKAVDTIDKEVGYVNLVVASAGITGPMNSFNPKMTIQDLRKNLFDEVAMERFAEVHQVNLTGAYFTMLAFLELLDAGNQHALKGGFGAPLNTGSQVPSIQSQVVFLGSIGSFSRFSFTPPAYMASKAAIVQLAKQAATNLAAHQIRVNILAPGFFPSEMTKTVITTRDPETEPVTHPSFIPARRFGTEEEMGGSILYLVSRAGAYCNGQILLFDGGRVAMIQSTY